MNRVWVDFRAVKASISMEMTLANYGVMMRRLDRCYLRGRCPLPTHRSTSSTQSFIVNTEKNAWACHSDSCVAARGGRLGGNILDFVAYMENCSIRDAALRLQEWFTVPHTVAVQRRDPGATAIAQCPLPLSSAEGRNPPLSFALGSIDFRHPYLAERYVSSETAEYFGVGFFSGKGSMEGRVVIPIHSEAGVLVAYAGRALGQTGPRYRFPRRFHKSLVLFNLHRAIRHGKSVVVVEGFFDCLKVHQAGLPCVVALMGCSLSHRQERLLQTYFHEVTLLLDGDKAGHNASIAIAARLVHTLSTKIVDIPGGGQPDQLGADQIRCLCIPGYF